MKSLSEIETTSKRASRAAGFPWGVAEEVGKGIRLLELFGFPGIKNLNLYYQEKNRVNFEKLKIINQNNKSSKFKYCPITIGVSFLDQIKDLQHLKRCTFHEVGYPLLLLPFLSIGSEIIGKKILYKIDKNDFLLNFNINISSNSLMDEFPNVANNIDVTFLENEDNFSDLEWKSLYKISEATFVEETDNLKQGAAGAGLTDND
tara:strand:- start:203 stop:814 length:612 start_codon:yes stop_codon:yes gene_type:complete